MQWSSRHLPASMLTSRVFAMLVILSLLLPAIPYVTTPPVEAQDGGVATYIAEKYICDPGFDPGSADAGTALAQCTQLAGDITFSLSSANPAYPGDSRATGGNGQAVWNDIPLGTAYSVAESIPEGFGVPWVYCEVTQGPGADQFSFFQAPGGVMDVGLTDPSLTGYQQAYCRWFNVPPVDDSIALRPQDDLGDIGEGVIEPVGTGRVFVRKHWCPTGYVITDPAFQRSNGECYAVRPLVTYTLVYGAGQSSTKETVSSNEGVFQTATWEGIPAGTVQITEASIEGYETLGVYCTSTPEGTNPPLTLDDAWSPENGWAEYVLQEDYAVICEWFNVRLPTSGDAGAVSVYKEYCPAGFVPPDIGEPYGSNDCPLGGPGPGFSFALSYGGQPAAPPDEQDGRSFAWYGIPGGELSLTEEAPAMYQTAAVYCDSFEGVDPGNPSAAAAPPPNRVPHDGNTLNWDLVEGNYLRCIWQNVPAEDAYGNVLIVKRLCPEGYTFGSKSLEDIFTECAEHQTGVQFALEHESGETVQATTQQTDQGAIAAFLEQPVGDVTITEAVPEGYYLGRVYCVIYGLEDDPALIGLNEYSQETPTGNSLAYRIDPGRVVSCFFFDVPGEAGTTAGSVIVRKYLCPPGFSATNPGIGGYLGYCTIEAGVEFTATQDPVVRQATTDAGGVATIIDVPFGSLRISELPREGYEPPRVFCLTILAETGAETNAEAVTVDNWGITYDLPEGYYLQCVWYNMPAATPSTDPATVILHKYTCPEEYPDENQPLETLQADCTERPEGVEFTVSPPTGPVSQEGATGSDGDVQFTGLATGQYVIEEVFNQGYNPLAAHCDFYVSATGSASNFDRYGVPVGLSTYLAGGYTLECYWFNYPYTEPVEITILKYFCPPTYGVTGAAREDVLFNCATPAEGVYFEVLGEEYQASAATDAAGLVEFEDIPPGPLAIVEHAAAYEALKVYCGETSIQESTPPTTWQELPVNAEVVQYQAQPGTRITCYWINAEAEYPHVVVHKHVCFEAAAPAEPAYEAIKQSCTPPLQDVTFELSAGGATESQTTDALGDAFWFDVPVGTVTLTETPPAEYPVAIVFCASHTAAGEQGSYQQIPVDEYAIQLMLPASYFYLECDWFNYQEHAETPTPASPTPVSEPDDPASAEPDETGATGTAGQPGSQTGPGVVVVVSTPGRGEPVEATLIITKFTCEPGFDLSEEEADPTVDCEELTDNILFTLEGGDEFEEVGITGEEETGVVEFSELEPGAYLLTEALPEDTVQAFINTCTSDRRAFYEENPFIPFAYAGSNGQIGVTLVAGETLECDWYDIVEDIPTGELTVTKYWCPTESSPNEECPVYEEGATFSLIDVDDFEGEPIVVETDETGSASVPMEGRYLIEEGEGAAICRTESEAFDFAGNLVVEAEQVVEIAVYNCGPLPGS